MKIFFEYIKYRWNAKALHGIHSPFVFKFMKDAFKIHPNQNETEVIYSFALKHKDTIENIDVQDHGAKSKKLQTQRSVKQIFQTSSSYGKNGLLLYRICSYFKPKNILELGTSIGMGSLYMHLGAPKSKLISIEGCPETYKIAKENLKSYPIELINNTFTNALEQLKEERFDIVFIDGHHDGNALLKYLEVLKPFTNDDTVFILDDIRWSSSMLESWNRLKNSKTYNLSMDFFRMGVLIKRPQQVKEHFILKLKK